MASTAHIRQLMLDALDLLERPFTDDVIDDAFHIIETTPDLRARYDALCATRRQVVVNNWGGAWVGRIVERRGIREVKAQKSTLIGQYSILDRPVPPAPKKRKVKLDEVARQVYDYYKTHAKELPLKEQLSTVRDEITAMVADGVPIEDAFRIAVEMLSGKAKKP